MLWLTQMCGDEHHTMIGERTDHRAVGVTVQLAVKPASRRKQPAAGDRKALAVQENATKLAEMWEDVPPFPPTWSSTMMDEALMARARRTFLAACPGTGPVPKSEWITPQVWVSLRAHAAARRTFWEIKQKVQESSWPKSKLRTALVAWKGRSAEIQLERARQKATLHSFATASFALKVIAGATAKEVRKAKATWLDDEARKVESSGGWGQHEGIMELGEEVLWQGEERPEGGRGDQVQWHCRLGPCCEGLSARGPLLPGVRPQRRFHGAR